MIDFLLILIITHVSSLSLTFNFNLPSSSDKFNLPDRNNIGPSSAAIVSRMGSTNSPFNLVKNGVEKVK